MGGFIGMSCREVARFSECYCSLMNMDRPPGTGFMQARSLHGPENWNIMADLVLKDKTLDWIFCTEDDHIYPPDTLTKLLARDKDIVSGIYLKRDLPFEPVAYHEVQDGTGNLYPHFLNDYESGMVEVDVVGVGCLLIRRKVFETVPAPWWILTAPPTSPDKINSDVEWCRNVKRHGFSVWCDLDAPVGHVALTTIVPLRKGGGWQTLLAFGDKGVALAPDRSSVAIPARFQKDIIKVR